MERGSSAGDYRTRNRENPGSNPPLLRFRRLGIFLLSMTPHSSASMTTCWVARMLSTEVELVPGSAMVAK